MGHSVEIQVKSKSIKAKNRYLIWVFDVISDGNYHAYYAAWTEITSGSNAINVFPVYQSGY